jgi:hypothetical protein
MNLMLINVSTHRYGRAARLTAGGLTAAPGADLIKPAVVA